MVKPWSFRSFVQAISKWLLNVQNEKIGLSELKKLLFVLIIDKH
jgi:hypothetical protein